MKKRILCVLGLIILIVGLGLSFVPGGLGKPTSALAYNINAYQSYGYDGNLENSSSSWPSAYGDAGTLGTVNSGSTAIRAGSWIQGGVYFVTRGMVCFDTSPLPDDAIITGVSLNLYLYQNLGITGDTLRIVGADSVTLPLQSSDFGHLYSETTYYGSQSGTGWSSGTWKYITLSSGVYDKVSTTGYTKLGLRSSNEMASIPPSGEDYFYLASSESTGGDPSLTVSWYGSPTVATSSASNIGTTEAVLNGNVTNTGGNLTLRGFVWGDSSESTPSGTPPGGYSTHWSELSSSVGTYSHNITGLTPGDTYYFRAYAFNGTTYVYGDEEGFEAVSGSPTMTTTSATSIAQSSATLNGTVTNDGGQDVTVYFQWGTTTSYGDSSEVSGGWITGGSPFCTITGLTASTTYHFRIVGYNNAGTSYGADGNFTTSGFSTPTVVTDSASNVASTTVTLRGHITNDGGSDVKIRFTYGTTPSANTSSTSWTGLSYSTGEYFTSDVTGLSIETMYYFRAEAEHVADLGQGSILSFTTVFTAPTNFTAKVSGQTVVNLSWTPQGDKTDVYSTTTGFLSERNMGYRIYYGTAQSYSVSSLDEGTTYYFTAWSWKSDDNTWSAISAQDAATTGSTTLTPMPSTEDVKNMVPDTPDTPTEWFQSPNGSNLSNWPFYTVVEDTATKSGIPSGSVWMMIAIIIVVVVGIMVWVLGGSVMLILLSEGVVIAGLSVGHLLPMWILLAYIIIGGSMAYLMKREA